MLCYVRGDDRLAEQYDVFHRLERISESLDQAAKILRSSEVDTKLKVKNWLFTWFILPFHSLLDFKGLFKGVKSLNKYIILQSKRKEKTLESLINQCF